MRTTLVLSMLVVLGQAQQTQPPKFTARAELVTVPVVVTRSGQFVSGLTRSDFMVSEDGKPQSIAFFEEVKAQTILLPPIAQSTFSNQSIGPADRPPLTMIVLDRARTPVSEFNNAVNEIKKFVSRYLQPGTPTMLAEVDVNGLHVLQDFTTSPEFILDALSGTPRGLIVEAGHIEGTERQESANARSTIDNFEPTSNSRASAMQAPDMSNSSHGELIGMPIDSAKINLDPNSPEGNRQLDLLHTAIERAEGDTTIGTLKAMEQIARSVSGIPGRKTLMWTSPGYVCPMMGRMKDLRGRQVAIAEQCETIWRLLNAANVSVYPIVPTQTENPMFSGTPHSTMVQQQLMLVSYAENTGGKACTYRNDLDECYHRAAEDSLRYYQLSYYAVPTTTPTWRKIEVKVHQPHTSVRARRWYVAGTERDLPPEEVVQKIAAAVVSPIDYTAVPMVVRWTGVVNAEGKKRASFEVRISPETLTIDEQHNNRLRLEVVAIEMDGAGRVTNALQQNIDRQLSHSALAELKAEGLTYTNSISISPSAVRVKFVVLDSANGRIGTVNARLPRSRLGNN